MKEEQIDRLLKIIEENGYATVKYIAKAVYASESTVRRQLAELEHMGLVVRSYGGAELYLSWSFCKSFSAKGRNSQKSGGAYKGKLHRFY